LLCQIVTHESRNMWSRVVLFKCDVVGLSLDERNDIRLNNFIPIAYTETLLKIQNTGLGQHPVYRWIPISPRQQWWQFSCLPLCRRTICRCLRGCFLQWDLTSGIDFADALALCGYLDDVTLHVDDLNVCGLWGLLRFVFAHTHQKNNFVWMTLIPVLCHVSTKISVFVLLVCSNLDWHRTLSLDILADKEKKAKYTRCTHRACQSPCMFPATGRLHKN
jgi:hypothetical protein